MILIASLIGGTISGLTNIPPSRHSYISTVVRQIGDHEAHQTLPHRLLDITTAGVGRSLLLVMVTTINDSAEKWIGYYAGLLLTGFWGANLATTLFWGYLSDKYGRKAIMLFGLFMTSLSTVYLGLSTCYHDAMWALVIQGACTGLVPVSKCSIGELANRQQIIHNAEIALIQQRQRLLRRQQQQRRRQQSAEWGHGLDEKTIGLVYWAESENDLTMAATANEHYDFASKGYSALVVALALGAALGPLAGGVLTKKMIPGFEDFPYFAPCLFASAVGIFITGVVGLILDETHPKWAKASELEKTLENPSRFEQMEELEEEEDGDMSRGRSGYENSRHYKAAQAATKDTGLMTVDFESGDVVASLSARGTTTMTTTLGTRPRLRQTAGAGTITPPTAVCTCHPHEPATEPVPLPPAYYGSSSSNNSNTRQPSSPLPSKLSPATELYLALAIYSLLVLTSILGSEFVMLYTQSPTFRGGLEFSAKTLGQILTLRGFLKLGFTLCGYPWIVKRIGLLKCLRLGVIVIGVFSVVGLGWFVPWAIFAQQESTRNRALVTSSVDLIGSAGKDAKTSGGEGGNLPAGGGGGGGGGRGEENEKTPVGMGVILLCLSLISMGDVLGYVSVLVLFGKSADRMKGATSTALTARAGRTGYNAPIDSASSLESQARINNSNYNNAGEGSGATGPGAQQGGSGVLWSVAQVSGNVMRLTGPVLAGLLWSLVDTSRALSTSTVTGLHHVPPFSGSSSSSASSMENQQHIMYPDSRLSQSASLTNNNNSKEPTLFGKVEVETDDSDEVKGTI
ncbi:hypothetical protein KI688_001876 [Linnemannia hyalina]|uniref:MFS general substrate transporter n=1 Tax=Linnemannia hyalina TaxID=64524 RepID=A0A9P7XS12_9FUNG|nr:hypothetical protein KI688_001876 [Linnemannia hyalina]